MKISALIEHLNDNNNFKWVAKCLEQDEIFLYERYHQESDLQPGIAYVCEYSSLPDTLPSGISFFCANSPETVEILHKGINIILFSGGIKPLLKKIAAQLAIEHRLQADKQILLDALDSGNGLQNLIETAHSMLKNPITVVDSAYKILAMDSSTIEYRPDLELQRELGYMMDKNIDSMKQNRIYEKARQCKYPYYTPEDPLYNTSWLITLIYVYGVEAAQMGVMECDHEFTHYDYELTHFLSKLISLELQKDDFYKHNQMFMHSALMSDILEGRIHDNTVSIRAAQLGWELTDEMYIMSIFDCDLSLFSHKARLVSDQIQKLCKNSRWVIWDNKIIFLLILGKNDDELNLWSELKEYLRKNKLTAAVSDKFSDLYTIQHKYLQCGAAYDIGNRLEPGGLLFFYKDYNLHHIGSVAIDKLPKSVLFHPSVVAMEKYDKENGTCLLETVKEYLLAADSSFAVADRLFIHKNTLYYRLNKAKELFGIDMNNGYEKMRIYMTMLMMEL